MSADRVPVPIALGGFGNVARQLVGAIRSRPELDLKIAAVSARDLDAAQRAWTAPLVS